MKTPNELPTQRLKRLAIQWIANGAPDTQMERQLAIREVLDARGRGLGGLSLTAARNAVETVAQYCRKRRLERRKKLHRWNYRNCGRALPSGTPAERLRRRRVGVINSALRTCLRSYAREENAQFTAADSLTDCNISLEKEEGWIEYSDKNRYGIVSAQYCVSAMLQLPIPREIGGLLTLGAERATALERENEQVYRAMWAKQGQGEPTCERGFIVATENSRGWIEYAHGKTINAARGVLTRRLGTQQRYDTDGWAKLDRWRQAVERKLRAGQINGYNVAVSMADARKAGLCQPGVEAWCGRHDIDPRGTTTVGEIMAIDDQRDYALAACMVAITRQS